MEAATLKKKKNSISKLKIRKTIKNVVCRPDPVFWPLVTDENAIQLETCLSNYRVHIPQFQKIPWKQLKLIPKSERPKPPPIQRVDGLIFGISECRIAIQNTACSAILVEAGVNPRAIIQTVIDICVKRSIPVLCLKDLKLLCGKYFGIPTSCLGIKGDSLQNLESEILKIYQTNYSTVNQTNSVEETELYNNEKDVNTVEPKLGSKISLSNDDLPCPYLYRTNKKTRVFVPDKTESIDNKFLGQNYIKLPDMNKGTTPDKKAFMKMLLKKMSNNPNRVKIKQ